jgi:hypothetical protein
MTPPLAILTGLLLLLLATALLADTNAYAPGGKYLVGDMNRPRPAVVTPGNHRMGACPNGAQHNP